VIDRQFASPAFELPTAPQVKGRSAEQDQPEEVNQAEHFLFLR